MLERKKNVEKERKRKDKRKGKLPDGVAVQAVTYGRDYYIVLGADDRLFVYDRQSGDLRQTVEIAPAGDR